MTMPEPIEHRFPCDSCGSDLRFDPGHDRLSCDHCGNTQSLEGVTPWERQGAHAEQDFKSALQGRTAPDRIEETRVFSCENCGATVEFDPAVHALECPFCATPIVTDTGTHRHIKPAGLLPFDLDERVAKDAMNKWLGRLWFAPNGLQEYARKGRKLNGIYIPYWTFDADTKTSYKGQRGTEHRVRDGDKTRTEVRWRSVTGRVARFFDDVLVGGSTSLPDAFTRGMGAWDLSSLEPYAPVYLAGFRAEAYTIELEPAFEHASKIMERQIVRDIKFDIGGDRQRVTSKSTRVSDVTFKHILLPVWMAAYKYQGKTYRYVVNGRTGQVYGERPWSWIKIAFAVLVAAAIAGAVGYFAGLEQAG
ncbi:MAG: primosomal protein N' (replication factor Y) - superfamily II helicase [Pseudomonadota bacterium]